jgi:hypothetical protein
MRLSQVVALEADAKKRTHGEVTAIHKAMQKGELYAGSVEVYEPASDTDEALPAKRVRVRMVAGDALQDITDAWAKLGGLTLSKELGNCNEAAMAPVTVSDTMTTMPLPVPALLFLEKQFTDMRRAIDVVPTLDEADEWAWDEDLGYHRTAHQVTTRKTAKRTRAIVLHKPTKEHPAQTQLISEDVTVGWWRGTKFSGAMTRKDKKAMLARCDEMIAAIKKARDDANRARVDEVDVVGPLFDYVLGK